MKWPRTLASRLAMIFFTGLVLAYGCLLYTSDAADEREV